MEITREQLEQGRHRRNPNRVYGHFFSYCEQQRSCETCDKKIARMCKKKNKIEEKQTKCILKICK